MIWAHPPPPPEIRRQNAPNFVGARCYWLMEVSFTVRGRVVTPPSHHRYFHHSGTRTLQLPLPPPSPSTPPPPPAPYPTPTTPSPSPHLSHRCNGSARSKCLRVTAAESDLNTGRGTDKQTQQGGALRNKKALHGAAPECAP